MSTPLQESSSALPPLAQWLEANGLARLEPVLRDNGIAEDVLTSLNETDLEKLGLSMGDRKRLLKAIAALATPHFSAEAPPPGVWPADTELRQLTIMFCDLVDATAMCARFTPEQWRDIVLAYQQAAVKIVARFGGAVAQYLGDGLLVYFGHPQALEDAPVRAGHAALALLATIPELDVEVDGHQAVQLRLRIGIDTGMVVIGDIGTGDRREQLALGDTPNIAARLQGLARSNTVVITDATRRLTAGSFVYEDMGMHALKGVQEPRQVWRIVGASDTATRFDASTGEQLSPLIGRVQEMGLLMERWQTTLHGQGQVVLLSGEPGIGKSRMLRELRERLGHAGHQAWQFQCAAHQAHSAFHPMVDTLARLLRIRPDMPAEIKLGRVDQFVLEQLQLTSRHAALLAAMMGLTLDERHELGASAAHQREQDIVDAIAAVLMARARQAPLLMLFEDAHWADPASVAALDKMVECARQLPVLVVITHRPEFTAAFDRQPHVTALKVPGLRRHEVAALVNRLTGDQVLPEDCALQIEDRTDGVPLFVEELTKSLLDRARDGGANCDGLSGLPVTLRDSLMARLDRHPGARDVAQVGAVIGREFSHALLAAIFPRGSDELDGGLQALLDAGLAIRQETDQGVLYAFKHALVQDTAYDSLTKARKEALHAAVVRTLQAQYPGVVQDQPALLARHAMAADLVQLAIPYWRRASEQALNRLALHEAAAHLLAGLEAVAGLPSALERDQTELQLQASLGTVYMLGKGWAAPEVEQAYGRASQLAASIDRVEDAIWPLWGVCVYHQVRGEIRQAQTVGRRMITVARQTHSRLAWLVTNMMHTQLFLYAGEFGQVPAAWEQVEHGYSDPHDRQLIALYSTDLKLVGMVHQLYAQWIMGQVEEIDPLYAAIEQRAQALGHPYSLAWTWTWAAMIYLHAGQVDRLRAWVSKGLDLAREHGFAYVMAMAQFALGWCEAQQGDAVSGLAQMTQGLDAFQATGAGIVLPCFLALRAEALGRVGRFDEALECLAQAWAQTERGGERWHEAELHRIRGNLLAQAPQADPLAARACYEQAMAVAQAQQAHVWQRRAADALAGLGP
jgi:class 3 adenylate cyclase/predicted ATPase/ABC-type transport system involved in cytochrome c biogenesis ATPase subunit